MNPAQGGGRGEPVHLLVRDASPADLPALCQLKPGEAQHLDRLRDASSDFRYLVLVRDDEVIGFACLVFVRPHYWSDANDRSNLPQIVDLVVAEPLRGRGYGSFFIREMERIAAESGGRNLYISVNFPVNERAHALYQRLGYQQMQPAPYFIHWEFADSGGEFHQGDDWRVDLVKALV
ncbi:MAG TPA: GNAT family N-acetyltransferase [Armatimonadota bacterium]|nr:GNAT family N-acetyltransferase [Armatimonadota bacterium]